MAAVTNQFQGMATLMKAMREIMGESGTGTGMNAKTMLDWAKWGHNLAKDGYSVPEFPKVQTTQPPSDTV